MATIPTNERRGIMHGSSSSSCFHCGARLQFPRPSRLSMLLLIWFLPVGFVSLQVFRLHREATSAIGHPEGGDGMDDVRLRTFRGRPIMEKSRFVRGVSHEGKDSSDDNKKAGAEDRRSENHRGGGADARTKRPTIHTFLEPRLGENGMETIADLQKLGNLWEREWKAAGWNTVVLNSDENRTNKRHSLRCLSRWNQMLFHRWIAISKLGESGSDNLMYWYSDMDVFPLFGSADRETRTKLEGRAAKENTLVLLERVAPSLVLGTSHAWKRVTNQLLHSAAQQCQRNEQNQHHITNRTATRHPETVYWTDTLALLDVLEEQRGNNPRGIAVENHVVSLDRVPVELPNTTVDSICQQRWLRQKWAVHVGLRQLPTFAQTSLYRTYLFPDISNAWILPIHRPQVAQRLLFYLRQLCH